MKYGVFTVSMPEYGLEETVKLLKECGYDGVEWRVADVIDTSRAPDEKSLAALKRMGMEAEGLSGEQLQERLNALHDPAHPLYDRRYWIYNKSTLDLAKIEEETKRAKAICDRYELEIFGLTGYIGADQPEVLQRLFKAAGDNDIPLVRVGLVMFDAETTEKGYTEAFADFRRDLGKIAELAAENGVKAVIELHHGTLTPSPSAAVRALEGLNPEHIGVTFDPGNMVFEGFENYQNGLRLLGDYLAHVHFKNGLKVPDGRDEFGALKFKEAWVPLKEGSADLGKFFRALNRIGYDRRVCIEDFSNEQTTEEKLRDGIAYMRALEEATK